MNREVDNVALLYNAVCKSIQAVEASASAVTNRAVRAEVETSVASMRLTKKSIEVWLEAIRRG